MARITILGLGAMGSRMAQRLLAAGHETTVWNRTPHRDGALLAAGAFGAASPRAAVAGAEIAIAMLGDDEASRAAWTDPTDGALAAMAAGAVAIESSTLSPGWVRALAGVAEARDIGFLDAPVVGSRPQAEAGQLIHLVGGEPETLDRVRPILAALGSAVHRMGPVGAGQTTKLVANTLFGVQVAALAEMLALARVAGLDPGALAAALGALPVASPAAKGAMGLILSGADAPLFPVDLVAKDFRYTLAEASQAGFEAPVAAAAEGQFRRAVAAGHGGLNLTAVRRLLP